MRPLPPVLVAPVLLLVVGCGDGSVGDRGPDGTDDAGSWRRDASTPIDAATPSDASPPTDGSAGDPSRAYLHVDLWSVWWNDRTRCGAERAFLDMCERRADDCSLYRAAWEACDPTMIVYGQVGPEKQDEPLCQRGRYPDVGGCDARLFDFDRLRFWWYGAEWEGNWPVATIKLFEAGPHDLSDYAGDGLVAYSNVPGHAQASMDGIANHGLDGTDSACAMLGATSGDAAYRSPFGGFAWIEVPTDRPVTVVAMAATNFADRAFTGCARGDATADPWVTDAPGAMAGCVYAQDHRFEAGHGYVWRYGRIEELPTQAPPSEILAGFAMDPVGIDVSTPDGCR